MLRVRARFSYAVGNLSLGRRSARCFDLDPQQRRVAGHLTIAFTAPALFRESQDRTGLSIRSITRQLRALRSATVAVNGTTRTSAPRFPTSSKRPRCVPGPETHALTK